MIRLCASAVCRHDQYVCRHDSAVCRHDSAVCIHDLAVCRHDSAVCRHDSAVFRHDSAVLRHDSVRCRHDSAVCRHESAVRRYDSNFNLSVIAIFLVLQQKERMQNQTEKYLLNLKKNYRYQYGGNQIVDHTCCRNYCTNGLKIW